MSPPPAPLRLSTSVRPTFLFLCLVLSHNFSPAPSFAMSSPGRPPLVYSIAGSDPSGGAGLQADLLAIHDFGCHPCTIPTCLTAQSSVGVAEVHTPPPAFLSQQLRWLAKDMPPDGVKIGMVGSVGVVASVVEFLGERRTPGGVVLDPVMISTSGHKLIEDETLEKIVEDLMGRCDLVTPNAMECAALLRFRDETADNHLETPEDVEAAARIILDMGARAVLIKGGHFATSSAFSQDYLLAAADEEDVEKGSDARPRLCDARRGLWIRGPRYDTEHTHGTGCTLSSAIASGLARGIVARNGPEGEKQTGAERAIGLADATVLGKAYVAAGIEKARGLGQGPGPVAHTSFPHTSRHFPTIVQDPSSNTPPPSFLRLRRRGRPDSTSSSSSSAPALGPLLPILSSSAQIASLAPLRHVTDLQLRLKNDPSPSAVRTELAAAADACAAHAVRLWVNDHWEAALDLCAASPAAAPFGVHLGQEDLCACAEQGGLARLREAGLALGVSTHSYAELAAALGAGVTYVSLGPVHGTKSKEVGFAAQGTETVRKWRELMPEEVPLVVIGGIDGEERARECREAGAECVAVIGAVTKATDVQGAVDKLAAAMID